MFCVCCCLSVLFCYHFVEEEGTSFFVLRLFVACELSVVSLVGYALILYLFLDIFYTVFGRKHYWVSITTTCLFKYTENFTTKK